MVMPSARLEQREKGPHVERVIALQVELNGLTREEQKRGFICGVNGLAQTVQ